MSKDIRDDPYKHIRRKIPPPEQPHKSLKDYNRNDEQDIIEKGIEDYYSNNDEDLKPFWEED